MQIPKARWAQILINNIKQIKRVIMDPTFVCNSGLYTGWKDMFYCTDPSSWAFMGVALALGLSIIGAAW